MKTLTENLKEWRQDRNITKADYLAFVGNILEELLEPIYEKAFITEIKRDMLIKYFQFGEVKELEALDAIQDIQVFCINETELMGYDNIKCNNEVFKEINSRKQDPEQAIVWAGISASGKWQKMKDQPKETLYLANYLKCKL